jgi:hypothetical protein
LGGQVGAIDSEQLEKISRLPLAKLVFINAENARDYVLRQNVLNGKYTHILVSPEIPRGFLVANNQVQTVREISFSIY